MHGRSIERLARLPIAVDGETDSHAWTTTLALARLENLSWYDAAYLDLAIRLGGPLATCDSALIRAANRSDIEVLAA